MMQIKPELVKKIRADFDLNIYETKVWLALLTKGIASAGEIAELSGVPRSRTYDVLESLEKRGFAIVKIGKPVKYISVKPTEVIEKIKSRTMNEANEKIVSLANLKGTPEYVELESLHNTGIAPIKSEDITGSIRGRSNNVSKIRELLENAEKEVLICTSLADFEDKSRVLVPSIEKLAKKNVKIKVALSGELDKIKKLNSKLGLNAKFIESKARLYITDKKEVLMMMNPESVEDDLGVWLNSPFLVDFFYSIINESMKGAK